MFEKCMNFESFNNNNGADSLLMKADSLFKICVLQNGGKSLVTTCKRGGKDTSL